MADAFTLDHFRDWAGGFELDNGDPWILEPFQCDFVADLFRGKAVNWLVVPEGNGKALALDTPIPTPDGWTEMGALEVGDEIMAADGTPCRVTFATEVMHGHACFRVVFSDGTSVVADADHLWLVRDAYRDERCRTLDVIKTTSEIAAGHRIDTSLGQRRHRYSLPAAKPLDLPEASLPLDPYVLGAWLGDGSSADARVAFGEEFVREEIIRCGYEVAETAPQPGRCRVQTVYGIRAILRELEVLGNKHIPSPYLRGSVLQRLNLLQGLMDTDGTISTPQGQCSITTVSLRLAADVAELVRSLGLKTTVRQRRARIGGRDCGPAWVVQFHAYDDLPVFRMPRKFNRQVSRVERRIQSETRRIVDAIPVASVPVRCIQVDSDSHLFLAGEGMVATHNTTLLAGLALYHLEHTRSGYVAVAASTRDQAEWIYRQAAGFVQRSSRAREFKCLEGYRRIRYDALDSRIQVFAADDRGGDGAIASMFILDELHRHKTLDLYNTWSGKLKKRPGTQLIAISTAGELGGAFETERTKFRQSGAVSRRPGFVRVETENALMHEWALEEGADPEDLEAVKRANPFSGVTLDDLRQKRDLPGMTAAHWGRFSCNKPGRSTQAAILESEWDEARVADEIPEGEPIYLGLDYARKWDTTALVPLWVRDPEYRLFGTATILVPPRTGESTDPHLAENALLDIHARNPIHTVVMDTSGAEWLGAWIEETIGAVVNDRSQTNPNAVQDYTRFMDALSHGVLHHTGDPGLRQHVLNGVARMLPGGDARFDRPAKSRYGVQDTRVIDALIAAAMVNALADEDAVVAPMVSVGW